MKFFLHPQAKEELDRAILFYQSQQVHLEKRFIEALEDAVNRICRNPFIYRKLDGDVRRCRLLHFPYALIFRQISTKIEIIAVMHLRKKPNYWHSRK